MLPAYYEYSCPVKILCGRKALSNLAHELQQLHVARPLLITDQGVLRAGLFEKVLAALGDCGMQPGATFTDTPADSSNRIVNRVAELYRAERCDGFVAIGGGSVLDTAKGVSIVVGQDVQDLLGWQGVDRISAVLPPYVAIPTTAGTGSEVTAVAVIYNEDAHAKMAFVSQKLYPQVAIIDPQMMLTMPAKITAATGMDALTHAVEALYSLQHNPVSDAMADAAIRLVFTHLQKAVEDGADEEARLGMANAALLAGISFSNSMVGVVHALAHATGAVAHVPHGVANSIYLPEGMRYNIGRAAEAVARVAELVGEELTGLGSEQKALRAVERVLKLRSAVCQASGMAQTLRETGVKEEQLPEIARATLDDGALTYNPTEVEYAEALALLQACY